MTPEYRSRLLLDYPAELARFIERWGRQKPVAPAKCGIVTATSHRFATLARALAGYQSLRLLGPRSFLRKRAKRRSCQRVEAAPSMLRGIGITAIRWLAPILEASGCQQCGQPVRSIRFMAAAASETVPETDAAGAASPVVSGVAEPLPAAPLPAGPEFRGHEDTALSGAPPTTTVVSSSASAIAKARYPSLRCSAVRSAIEASQTPQTSLIHRPSSPRLIACGYHASPA